MSQRERVDLETRRVLAQTADRAEAFVRSTPLNAAVTTLAGLLALSGALFDFESFGPVELTSAHVVMIATAAWALYELATIAYHLLGPSHPAYRAAVLLDRFGRSVAVLTLLVLSASASVLFMIVSLPRGFAWRAKPPAHVRQTLWLEVTSHVAVALGCLMLGRLGAATLVVLALCAFVLASIITAQPRARTVSVRVERDLLERDLLALEVSGIRGRIARELHDGAGADLMALVLQLRRASQTDTSLSPLHGEARRILEDLRGVVWSIRGGEGTLGELVKLLDARCARACEAFTYERVPLSPGLERTPIGPATALAALSAAPELIRLVASGTWLRLTVSVGLSLELRVETDGVASPELQPQFQERVTALPATFSSEPLGVGAGTRLRLALTLEA